MAEKKESKDWYIAMTHWLTSGFAIPLLVGLVVGLPVTVLIGVVMGMMGMSEDVALKFAVFVVPITWLAVGVLGIWLGVKYSARYLAKTYIIRDSQKIVKLATIYLAVLGGIWRLIGLVRNGFALEAILSLVFFAVIVYLFYTFSKKYVKNTDFSEGVDTSQISPVMPPS